MVPVGDAASELRLLRARFDLAQAALQKLGLVRLDRWGLPW